MKNPIILLLTYFTLLNPAIAEVIEYDFELIIFEDTSGRYANSEQWQDSLFDDTSDTLRSPDAAQQRNPGYNSETSVAASPDEAKQNPGNNSETNPTRSPDAAKRNPGNMSGPNAVINISEIEGIGLDEYVKKLEAAKRYRVLVHKAWRQTGLSEEEAIDIPIDSRATTVMPGSPAIPDIGMQSSHANDTNNIHGTIKVVLARYLHFYTNLVYHQPRKDAAPLWNIQGSQPYKEYPIKFHRRMRSKELHYLDHPMVGILIKAMPVEKPEEPKEEA